MLKTFLIGLKDLKIAFRDRAAIIFMLLTPFLLTIGMGLVTGRFSSNDNSGSLNIPIVIVNLDNLDNESLGNALVEVFSSEELADLLETTTSQDAEAARLLVDEDEITVAIIIPAGFTENIFSANVSQSEGYQVEFYANPSRPTSAGIVKTILDGFMARVDEMRVGGITSVAQLMISGRISPAEANQVGEEIGTRFENAPTDSDETLITLNTSTNQTETNEVDMLAYIAPGMALMFLMYTVSYGGRSILAEKSGGTLTRLLVTPTNSMQILGGKVFGIFLTGAAQMFILIGATTLLFQLQWGDVLGVVLLVFAAVFGATGWGLLITAFAQSPNQVGSVGSAVMLIFSIMGGSFIQVDNMPAFVQTLSKITPNAWALDGFTSLAFGGNIASLTTPLLALLTMGIVLFLVSAFLFGRKNLVQK